MRFGIVAISASSQGVRVSWHINNLACVVPEGMMHSKIFIIQLDACIDILQRKAGPGFGRTLHDPNTFSFCRKHPGGADGPAKATAWPWLLGVQALAKPCPVLAFRGACALEGDMHLLVTGSAGLVGARLVTRLREAGHTVVEFDVSIGGEDIRDPLRVGAAMAPCDGVIHLAAISRVAWGEADPALCRSVNIDGTARLLEAAAHLRPSPWFLFISSREVYGDPGRFPVQEDASMAPVNHYGKSKAEGERLVEAARKTGLRCAIVRLTNVYGALNDHPDRAVPSLLWRALAGEELRISGANNFFDFVHVDDCTRGLIAAADRLATGAESVPTVHLASGQQMTLGQLAQTMLRVTQSKSDVTLVAARSFDVKGFCGDPARASEVLGWTAEIGLEEGIGRLMARMIHRGRPLDPVLMPGAQAVMSGRARGMVNPADGNPSEQPPEARRT